IRHIDRDALGGLGSGTGRLDVVVAGHQCGSQKSQDCRLIVDDEHSDLAAHDGVSARGKASTMRVPHPLGAGLTALIEPPWASIPPLAIARPNPVPSPPSALPSPATLPRTNFSNTCGSTSAAMPGPVSVTRIDTRRSSRAASKITRVSLDVCATA